jgi:glycosyltransferase involved in cell wall biosynthesis
MLTSELERAGAARGGRGRPRLLFCARRPPFPTVTGARIRTHRLLTGLAATFETTFVCFENHPRSPDGHVPVDELRRLLPGIEIVTVPGLGPGKRFAQARSVLSSRSWEYGRYRKEEMRDVLERLVAEKCPEIVHYDDLGVAQLGPLGDGLNVYSAHNVEYRVLDGTANNSVGLRRAFARIERRKVEQMERRVWQAMSLSLACSELDSEELRAGGARAIVCENGADPVGPLAPPRREPGEPLRVLFVGAADYRPNQLGLEWFVTDVLPRVREHGAVTVDVVGTPPRRFTCPEGVELHGRVPSVQPYYERAHAVIVPVLYGSGTRLKVIEAMAYGRPVVSTAAGAEGLPVSPGRHYYEADDAAGFADALVAVSTLAASGGGTLDAMIEHARDAIEPLLWPNVVDRLTRAYLDVARSAA